MKNVTIDYTKVNNNDESLDAFFHSQKFTVDGSTIPVKLTRPFAQLNVGTADLEAAKTSGVDITQSSVTITNAANGINLLTKQLVGDSKEVTFSMNAILTGEKVTVNEITYDYLSMNYFLVDAALGEQTTAII